MLWHSINGQSQGRACLCRLMPSNKIEDDTMATNFHLHVTFHCTLQPWSSELAGAMQVQGFHCKVALNISCKKNSIVSIHIYTIYTIVSNLHHLFHPKLPLVVQKLFLASKDDQAPPVVSSQEKPQMIRAVHQNRLPIDPPTSKLSDCQMVQFAL
jgi:hypothetical protein